MNKRYLVYTLAAALILCLGIIIGLLFALASSLPPSARLPLGAAHAAEAPEALGEALAVQETFRSVSAAILSSVVEITVQSESRLDDDEPGELPWDDFFTDPSERDQGPRFFRSSGLGSGVIVENTDDTFYIATNAHVVGEGEGIEVLLYNQERLSAELVGRDERKDLALLRIEYSGGDLLPATLGDSDTLYVGDWVLAFGSPYGYEHSVSSGIVSALGRRSGPGGNISDFIQTDASINQGNSGGPLANIRGEVVGLNTFITTPSRGSIGLGFAIPVNNIRSTVRQLIDTGEIRYGWLGVSLGAMGSEAAEQLGYTPGEGAFVYQVFEDSPAARSGLRPGDLILSLDGVSIGDHERMIYRIGDKAPGDTARFLVNRFDEILEVDAVMGEREDEEAVRAMHPRSRPGFVPSPLTDEIRDAMELPPDIRGAAVAEVYPRTPAKAADLRAGDIILEVDGTPIGDLRSLYLALGEAEDPVSFTVYREGERITLREIGEPPR